MGYNLMIAYNYQNHLHNYTLVMGHIATLHAAGGVKDNIVLYNKVFQT